MTSMVRRWMTWFVDSESQISPASGLDGSA